MPESSIFVMTTKRTRTHRIYHNSDNDNTQSGIDSDDDGDTINRPCITYPLQEGAC